VSSKTPERFVDKFNAFRADQFTNANSLGMMKNMEKTLVQVRFQVDASTFVGRVNIIRQGRVNSLNDTAPNIAEHIERRICPQVRLRHGLFVIFSASP
jgi:hypothetical protein